MLKTIQKSTETNLNIQKNKQQFEEIKLRCGKNYEKIQALNLFQNIEEVIKNEQDKYNNFTSNRKLNTSEMEKERLEKSSSKIYSKFRNSVINLHEMKIGILAIFYF